MHCCRAAMAEVFSLNSAVSDIVSALVSLVFFSFCIFSQRNLCKEGRAVDFTESRSRRLVIQVVHVMVQKNCVVGRVQRLRKG